MSAAIDVGKAAKDAADKHETPCMVVATQVDPFGNTVSRKATTSKMKSASSCDIAAGADPSLVSDHSSPWLRNWWSTSVISQTAAYLDTGTPIKTLSGGLCDMTVKSSSPAGFLSSTNVVLGLVGITCLVGAVVGAAFLYRKGGNEESYSSHEQL